MAEFLELEDGTIIPPDGFEPIMAGPKWNREVIGYKIGMSPSARMAHLRYVGDRPMGREPGLAVDRPGTSPGRLVCSMPAPAPRTRSAPWRR